MPLPVRIVLSSLYILEGTVTATDINFLKFSRTYVPMQCSVSLTLNALYIGYAKKRTFFSVVLEDSARDRRQQLAIRQEQTVAALAAARKFVGTVTVGLVRTLENKKSDERPKFLPDLSFTQGLQGNGIATMKEVLDHEVKENVTLVDNGPKDYRAIYKKLFVVGWFNGFNKPSDDVFEKSFEDGSLTSVTLSISATVFGPHDPASVPNAAAVSPSEIANNQVLSNAPQYKSNLLSRTLSTADQWNRAYGEGRIANPRGKAAFVPSDINLWNNFATMVRPDIQKETSTTTTKKWSVYYRAKVEFVLNGTTYALDSGSWQQYDRNGEIPLRTIVSLDWGSLPIPGVTETSNAEPGNTSSGTSNARPTVSSAVQAQRDQDARRRGGVQSGDVQS